MYVDLDVHQSWVLTFSRPEEGSKVDFSKCRRVQTSVSFRHQTGNINKKMAALPISASGGPLLYGLLRPTKKHPYVFMAVTLDGGIFRLEKQGTLDNPRIGFRCKTLDCLKWVTANGVCQHTKACVEGKEARKAVARKMVIAWALFHAWQVNQRYCGMVHFIQFAALCGLEVDQEDYDAMTDIRTWAAGAKPEVVPQLLEKVESGAVLIQDFNRRFPDGPGDPPPEEPRREEVVPRRVEDREVAGRLAKIRKRRNKVLGQLDKAIRRKRSKIELLRSEVDREQEERDEQQRRFDAQVETLLCEREALGDPNNRPGDPRDEQEGQESESDHSDDSDSGTNSDTE